MKSIFIDHHLSERKLYHFVHRFPSDLLVSFLPKKSLDLLHLTQGPRFSRKMPSLLLVFILTLLLFQYAYSTEEPIPQIAENPQNQDGVLSLLDRHEAQLDRLETLIESLYKSISSLEKSSLTTVQQHSVASLQSNPQTSQIPFFSTKFISSAFIILDSDPTSAAALPYVDASGAATYFAVGGQHGNTYIISVRGEIVLSIPAVSDSEVTSILSYHSPVKKNQTLIYTGHKDGSVAAHRVTQSNSGVGWMRLELVESRSFVRGSRDLDSPPVVLLELHMVRRVRYVVAADGGGRIRVFMENGGTLYGTAIASGKVLAFMKQRLLFLTERGAGSLDLRSMLVKETECEGLNGSLAQTYIFDTSEPTKAYGFTSLGDLIHIVLLGDTNNLKCRVRSIRKSEINPEPVLIQSIRGYLLASTLQKIHIYNISSQYHGRVGAPRPLFSATLLEIKSTSSEPDKNPIINNVPALPNPNPNPNPLIATDRERVLLLGLGGGYIGIFHSNFPVYKQVSNHVFWSVPLLLFLLFFIGLWQFYVKKKDSLGWAPDESFDAGNERVFGDVVRGGDIREMRGAGLRGPTRRYVSPPSRYAVGSGMPYRSAASGTVTASATASDAAFRGRSGGSTLETPPGFPPRREQLFSNASVGDQHID